MIKLWLFCIFQEIKRSNIQFHSLLVILSIQLQKSKVFTRDSYELLSILPGDLKVRFATDGSIQIITFQQEEFKLIIINDPTKSQLDMEHQQIQYFQNNFIRC